MPQAEELLAVEVAKLSTEGLKDVGTSAISPFYFCFIQVSSILDVTQCLQPFQYLDDEQTEHLTSCQR